MGWLLWAIGVLTGGLILLVLFGIDPMFSPHAVSIYTAMTEGAMLAVPAVLMYMLVPLIIDRYNPKPLFGLFAVFLWGALAGCGIAVVVNDTMQDVGLALGGPGAQGKAFAEFFSATFSAPFVEEGMKGMALLGLLLFFRRNFDGVVDGVVFATFTALGFATFENITYYERSALTEGAGGLLGTFFLRGILSPWCHPVFTSMTGLGVGIARESSRTWVRLLAPVVGYGCAVLLHMTWNGAPTLLASFSGDGAAFLGMYLLFWIPLVTIFLIVVVFLVRREGRIIRQHLQDEMYMGNLTPQEINLICSPFGRLTTLLGRGGFAGRRFIDAASKLALSKYHTAVANKGRKATISADFVLPLRQEMLQQRAAMGARR